jgi:phospholipase D1/2
VNADRRQLVWRAAMVLIPIAAVVLLWHFAGLSQYRSAQDVARALQQLAAQPFGFALVPLGFALGAVLFVPVNALILGVTLSFDPLRGAAFAMAGGLMGGAAGYGVGRLFGAPVYELLRGPRIERVVEKLRRNPFRTSLLLHLMPIGNFAAINLLAGSLRVPFGGFLLGTALGLLPGVVLFVVLRTVHAPAVLVVGGIVVLLVVGFLLERLYRRREHVEA